MDISVNEFLGEGGTPFVPGQNVNAKEFGQFSVAEPRNEGEKLGFLTRVGQDLKRRSDLAVEIKSAVDNGEQSYAEGVLQSAGKVGAGAVLDFVGEAVISGGRGLSAITPDIIEKPMKDAVIGAGIAFLNTKVGQTGLKAAKAGAAEWFEFKDEHPRAARNIESVINIGILLAPTKGKAKVKTKPTIIGKAGQKITEKGVKQSAKQRASFADDLVRPKQTAKIRVEQTGRTIETGPLKSKKIIPTAQEAEIAKEALKLPVSKKNTLQGNLNIISQEVSKESDALIKALQKNDVLIPKKEYLSALDDAALRLSENPFLTESKSAVDALFKKMRSITSQNKGTASGLLKSRKELDAWMRSQKGSSIFDPKNENALSTALREIRTTTNDFIDLKATNVAVKQSLKKQSNLLGAVDNIAPKAAEQASNVVLRGLQNAMRAIPVKNEIVQAIALVVGVGGLGAAAQFAPFVRNIIFGSAAFYGAGKAITSPAAKKALGGLLKSMDDAIRVTKDEALLSQMRADRALILEMLKEE